MSRKNAFPKIARQSRGVDILTPQGRTALDNDIDQLYRLLAAGLGAKYLNDTAQDDFSAQEETVTLEPEESEGSATFDPEESEDTIPLDPEESEDSVDLQQEVIPVSGGGTGTTAPSAATADIKQALVDHGIITGGGTAPLDLVNGNVTGGTVKGQTLWSTGALLIGAQQVTLTAAGIASTNYSRVALTSNSGTADNCDGIGGSNDSRFVWLMAEHTHVITVRHNQLPGNTNNILLRGGANMVLDGTATVDGSGFTTSFHVDIILLISHGGNSYWREVYRSYKSAPTYTQTYATADRTHATPTVGADLGAFTDPPTAAEMAALRTFCNALKADHADLAQLANSILDDLQAEGTFQ